MNASEEAYNAILVEKLVKTVSRAMYSDTVVVVMDALLREKFIREEEMGPRLRLKEKDWRKVTNQMEGELLIHHEKVLMEDMRQPSVYYIDYQMFVDVVRYRVYLMRRKVNSAQSQEIAEVKYKCPTCKRVIGMTEAMLCKSKDYKFICTVCCPYDDFRQRPAEASYILQSEDNSDRISDADNLKNKVDEALNASDLHEGILELLAELKDVPLTRNLPSDNMSLGIKNTTIDDEDMENAIKSNTRRAVSGKKGRFVVATEAAEHGDGKQKFDLNLDEDMDEGHNSLAKIARIEAAAEAEAAAAAEIGDGGPDSKRDKSLGILPEFLSRSGVYGSDAAYGIQSLNAGLGGISGVAGVAAGEGEGGSETKVDEKEKEEVRDGGVLKVQSLAAPEVAPEIHQSLTREAEQAPSKDEGEEEEEDDMEWED